MAKADLFIQLVKSIDELNRYLLLHPSVNEQDEEGKTLVFYAISARNPESLRLLLKMGADINIKDFSGVLPTDQMYDEQMNNGFISFKLKECFTEIKTILTETPNSILFLNKAILFNAVREGSLVGLHQSVKCGGVSDVNIRLTDGTTPLHLAAKLNHPKLVKRLLQYDHENMGLTVIQNPSFLHAKDVYGKTALDYAIALNHSKCQDVLRNYPTSENRTQQWDGIFTDLHAIERTILNNCLRAVMDEYELGDKLSKGIDNLVFYTEEFNCFGIYVNVPSSHSKDHLPFDLQSSELGVLIADVIYTEDEVYSLNALVEDLFDTDNYPGEPIRYLMARVCVRLMRNARAWGIPVNSKFMAACDKALTNIISDDNIDAPLLQFFADIAARKRF